MLIVLAHQSSSLNSCSFSDKSRNYLDSSTCFVGSPMILASNCYSRHKLAHLAVWSKTTLTTFPPKISHSNPSFNLRMIMPRDGFEEAESVAERLYRKSQKNVKKTDVDVKDVQKSEPVNENDRKTVFELELARPLGLVLKEINGYGVFVEALTNGSAILAGVRRGDRVIATCSTIGNIMWEKSSLDGILAAVNSGYLPPSSLTQPAIHVSLGTGSNHPAQHGADQVRAGCGAVLHRRLQLRRPTRRLARRPAGPAPQPAARRPPPAARPPPPPAVCLPACLLPSQPPTPKPLTACWHARLPARQ